MHKHYFTVGQRLVFNNIYHEIIQIRDDNLVLKNITSLSEISITLSEAIKLFEVGSIQLISVSYQQEEDVSKPIKIVSEQQSEKVLRCYEYIKAADVIYSKPQKKDLDRLILEVSKKIGDQSPPSPSTVYQWWKKWLNSGRQLKSLEDQRKGRQKNPQYEGTFQGLFYEVVNEVYLTRERRSKQEVYLSLKSRVKKYNSTANQSIEMLSRSSIYRRLENLDDYTVMAERHGLRAAKQKYRMSRKGVDTTYPLERAEIDHTPLDIMVIDEKTELTIGRPYLTCILDCHTRVPLALSIGFEPPSELSVIRALKQAIWKKDELIKDIPDIKGDWPASGIPTLLVCDNGLEFHSDHLRRVCGELNIEMLFCPKHEPHYKGRVERFLGTLNREVSHNIQGKTFSNIVSRGTYDPKKEASLTLSELQSIIYFWLVDIYLNTVHRSLGTTPYKKWEKDIQRVPPLYPPSKAQFNLICAKKYERTLSHEGIHFERLTYNSEELRTMRILYGNRATVQIRVDPENIEKIWVYDKDHDVFREIPCVEMDYVQGLTYLQHKVILKERQISQKKIEGEMEEGLISSKDIMNNKIKGLKSSKGLRKRSQAARFGEVKSPIVKQIKKEKIPKIEIDLNQIPSFDLMDESEDSDE